MLQPTLAIFTPISAYDEHIYKELSSITIQNIFFVPNQQGG